MSWLDTLEQIRTRDFSKASAEEREKACREVVNTCSYAATIIALVPLPFSDALLTLPVQSGMVLTVSHIYGRKLSKAQAKDLAIELGTLAGASLLARTGIKAILPVVGALLTMPAAFAANWAIGRVAMEYFKNPEVSKAYLKKIYGDAINEGKARFSKEELARFRSKNDDAVKDAEQPAKPKARAKKKPAAKAKRPAGTSPTAKHIVEEELPKRIARKGKAARGIGKVIHLELSGSGGGTWTIDLTRDAEWIKKGKHGTAAMTARARASDFVKLGTGQLDAAAAVMDGALKLDPLDVELAQAFGKLIA